MLLVLEARGLVRTVAKWFAGGMAATAKRDCCAPAKAEWLALHVDEFDFPFNAQGTIVADRDLCRWHPCSRMQGSAPRLKLGIEPACSF